MDGGPDSQGEDVALGGYWWAMLIVAVLAVPAAGLMIALAVGARGFFGVAIIMATCWASTWCGMRLMRDVPAVGTGSSSPGGPDGADRATGVPAA